jgi:glycosyltransferase involved in cell wall biosynthesis
MDWGTLADVVVSHSGHDTTPLAKTSQPIIHVAHGRPLSTFLNWRTEGGAPVYTYSMQRSVDPRYRAAVTFWPEYAGHLRTLWGKVPVHVVPPPVDTEYWSPGETDYDFAGRAGGYNVVMTDPWSRIDVIPMTVVHAFALFRNIVPEARLHIYAVDNRGKERDQRLINVLKLMLGDSLGVVQVWAKDLRRVYRAADMLITPHRIYTRSIREAMACGLQVVSGRDCHPEDIEDFALEMARRRDDPQPTRKMAAALFDPAETGRAFLHVAGEAVNGH